MLLSARYKGFGSDPGNIPDILLFIDSPLQKFVDVNSLSEVGVPLQCGKIESDIPDTGQYSDQSTLTISRLDRLHETGYNKIN